MILAVAVACAVMALAWLLAGFSQVATFFAFFAAMYLVAWVVRLPRGRRVRADFRYLTEPWPPVVPEGESESELRAAWGDK